MSAPSYEQVRNFSNVTKKLEEAAIDEFVGELYEGMSQDEMLELAILVADKYKLLGAELGAQWYDLCSEIAGYDLDPAELVDGNPEIVEANAKAAAEKALATGDMKTSFAEFLNTEILASIRMTGDANLRRDYKRGLGGGKWARVPVGDTCAWCIMLASAGAWYVDEKSALKSKRGDKYHPGCDCVAVYHADAESIEGYSKLQKYKSMYYRADNMRIAAKNGKAPYPEDLEDRVNIAKLEHAQMEAEGQETSKWSDTNETLIVMRYMYGLK